MWKGKIYAIKENLSSHKAANLLALFFVVVGAIAGFRSVNAFSCDEELMTAVLGYGENYVFFALFFQYIWWRLAGVLLFWFFSLWFLGIFPAIFVYLLLIGAWCFRWGCLFAWVGTWTTVWSFLPFLLVMFLFLIPLQRLAIHAMGNIRRIFRDRHVPKTAMDTFLDAKPYLLNCGRLFLVILLGTALEAILVPAIFLSL